MNITSTVSRLPLQRGWLGDLIKPRIARAFIRKATKPKLKASPEALRALQKAKSSKV